MKMEIPFVYGAIASGKDFTGREKETKQLSMNLKGLINTAIISPRRWGKTSLVNKALEDIKEDSNFLVAHIDLFGCRTESAFYRSYANAILTASATKVSELIELARQYVGRFAPSVRISDPASQAEISFGIDFKSPEYSDDEILDLPQKIAKARGRKFIVCIDEFQNIAEYEDSEGFQKVLRSHWQTHSDVGYCLYGSKRHMLIDIFGKYESPFYRFGDIIHLDKMSADVWTDFIVRRFRDTGKSISKELANEIAMLAECHSYYVQQLSQQVWLRTEETASEKTITDAFNAVIDQLSLLFNQAIDSLRPKQISFLLAVAAGEVNFSSREVLRRYNLGTSANIKNLKKSAIEKDFVDIDSGKRLTIQDPMFAWWLKNRYRSWE